MDILDNFSKVKILVVGDVMIDRYWWGSVSRISPEAPVPIVRLEKTSVTTGGAANVAANLAGLGISPFLCGIVGEDEESRLLEQLLTDSGISNHFLIPLADRPTTVKTRIVAHSQHVVRIDQETVEHISESDADMILQKIAAILPEIDAVIISDYAKGFLSDHFLNGFIELIRSSGKVLFVDPKGRDFMRYKGATVITPNKREAAEACGLAVTSNGLVSRAGKTLLEDLDLDALLITEGEDGMTLFDGDAVPAHFDSLAQNVYDVTGAGDTVIATFAAAAASGRTFLEAAKLANIAAGLVVGKIGTTTITKEMIVEFLVSGSV